MTTKMITVLMQLSYEDRIKQSILTMLETGRIRGDQTEILKVVYGFENIFKSIFVKVREANITRRHKLMISKESSKLDSKKYSFSQRVGNTWNNLPTSVNLFKYTVDK